MVQVEFTGWRDGFRKVSFTQLLVGYTDLSLKDAKSITDNVLDNRVVKVLIKEDLVIDFVREAEEIGAISNLNQNTTN